MAYYRIEEEIDKPNRFWSYLGGLALLAMALSFAYVFIGMAVLFAYNPYEDPFWPLLVTASGTFLFSAFFLIFCAHGVSRRFGRRFPLTKTLLIFLGVWLSATVYLLVSKEPWPEHHEWAFDGEVYKTEWSRSGLGLSNRSGQKRSSPSGISYPYCVVPFRAVPAIGEECQYFDHIRVSRIDLNGPFSTEAGAVWSALKLGENGQDQLAISNMYGLSLDRDFSQDRYLTNSSSSSGGQNRIGAPRHSRNIGVAGRWTTADTTHGSITVASDIDGAQGFRQKTTDGREFTYYFWAETNALELPTHWAVCEEPNAGLSETFCYHSEALRNRMYTYTVPTNKRTDWRSYQEALVQMVEKQRIS